MSARKKRARDEQVLFYPDGGWGYTPTWHALYEADRLLFDDARPDAAKAVLLITDGVPAATAGGDEKNSRAVYLTLQAATALKNKGARHARPTCRAPRARRRP